MAGSILVFLAILGGAVFLAAALRRCMAETIPLSVVFLIAHTVLCGLLGLLKFSVIVTVPAMIALGVLGLYLSFRRPGRWRPVWDLSPVFFALGFAWILYVSVGRIPLEQAELTQWALAPKAMFYANSLTPPDGVISCSPALSVFQTVFQVGHSLFSPGGGFADWLLYVAGGTACLALLLPFAVSAHPKKYVRAAYAALFFLVILCLSLNAFDLFSALNPDGLLAILAAAGFLVAAQKKSVAQAVILGLYLFALTLIKDAGLYFALGALIVYAVTLPRSDAYRQSQRARRAALIAVPVLCVLLARLSWPHLSFALHGAAPVADTLRLYWQNFLAKSAVWRAGLSLGQSTLFTLFTLRVSYLGLTAILAGVTVLLVRAMKARETLRDTSTALLHASAAALLYVIGLWFAYLFAIDAADTAKLAGFQRLIGVGYTFWLLLVAASAFRVLAETPKWTWRRHVLVMLACLCVALTGSGAIGNLTSRDFIAANDRYHTYFAIAGDAKQEIPADASVYIVSQNDDGTAYNTLRYALYPRRVNPAKTCWLSDPAVKPNEWAYPVTPEQWKAELSQYDYALIYRADTYLQTIIAPAITADAVIATNTVYRVDPKTGFLVAAGTEDAGE
ncbi:MAG: hypothetical protein ABIK64_00760 [Bacillota bacterium]